MDFDDLRSPSSVTSLLERLESLKTSHQNRRSVEKNTSKRVFSRLAILHSAR